MAAVLCLAGVTAASAQFNFGSRLKVNIPNEFVIGDKLFPAGNYTIAPTPSTTDSSSTLILRGEKQSMIFSMMPNELANAATDTQLVFNVVDGTPFLSKIVIKGETTGGEIPMGKMEKRLIADNVHTEQIVVGSGSSY